MYKCRECGEGFSEPRLETHDEWSEYWGRPVAETLVVEYCPMCGSEEIEEVNECKICGSATKDIFSEYCDDCHADLSKALEAIEHDFGIDYESLQDMLAEHFGWR